MRLYFQGYLISLLFLLSANTNAAVDFDYRSQSYGLTCDGYVNDCILGTVTTSSGNHFNYRYACTLPPEQELLQQSGQRVYQPESWDFTNNVPIPARYHPAYICVEPPPQECATPNIIDPETGECVPPPVMPEECREIGEAYDPNTKQCVEECPHGMFNGACLPPPEEQPECNRDAPDYRGEVVLGYGQSPIPACGNFDQCTDDKPGQVGFFQGELRCIAEDFGVPKCKGGTIATIDNYGFACVTLSNQPEEPEIPEEPNTDTTGDGQPDQYVADNDPNIHRKQLDQLNKNQQTANDSLSNLENIGTGTNRRLDDINQGVSELVQMGRDGQLAGGGGSGDGGSGEGLKDGEGNDYLADIKQNTRETADALEAPEGGLSTDGLGDAPTFSDSVARLKVGIFEHPTIQTVTTIPTLGTSTSCPTWTIPANDYWDALTMDVHCAILEDHRSTFSVMFLFFWTIVAIFLFLRA
jgi:hypothetical protein